VVEAGIPHFGAGAAGNLVKTSLEGAGNEEANRDSHRLENDRPKPNQGSPSRYGEDKHGNACAYMGHGGSNDNAHETFPARSAPLQGRHN
jgi:hypothetical protein